MEQIRINTTEWVDITGTGAGGARILNTTGHLVYMSDDGEVSMPLETTGMVAIGPGSTLKFKTAYGEGLLTVHQVE